MSTSIDYHHSNKRRIVRTGIGVLLGATVALSAAIAASAHGYIGGNSSDVVGRAALKANTDLGAAQWDPHSIEGPKGFPESGPADGQIASGGNPQFHKLDEQTSTRWVKNAVRTSTVDIGWTYTARHATAKWHYYLTKQGWDQNAPLRRDELQKIKEIPHDGSLPSNGDAPHRIAIPEDRSGYHLLLGVWDIADTANAFYQVVDLDVKTLAKPEPPAKPSAPIDFRATAITDTSVSMSWRPPVNAPADLTYAVERLGPTGGFREVGRTPSTEYSDTDLTPSTMYQYHVRGIDASGARWPVSEDLRVVTHHSDPDQVNAWNSMAAYLPGDVVTSQNQRYLCLQYYQGHGDPGWINAPSLWKRID